MITKFGKRFLTGHVAGISDFSTKDLAIGIGSTAATSSDTKLEFEFYRMPVTLSTIDIQTNETGSTITARDGVTTIAAGQSIYYAIYKSTIPQDVSGVISEIGLYPGLRSSFNSYDSKFITQFDNNLVWSDGTVSPNPLSKSNNTTDPFISKIGDTMVGITSAVSSAKEYKNSLITYDLSGYSVNDSISIAYKKMDTNVSRIRLKFYSSASAYCWIDFTPLSGTGDKIQSLTLNNLYSNVTNPAPDLTSIVSMGVEVTANSSGSTLVYFDGVRINDEDTFDPGYGIISRSILSSPLTKIAGRPVDIEYKLLLGF